MLKWNHQELEGNDRYEGFCVDMLKELAEILRFNYKIHLVGDGVYGVPEANGTWTGMVGELIARVSGLAAPFNSAPLGFGAAKPRCFVKRSGMMRMDGVLVHLGGLEQRISTECVLLMENVFLGVV